VFSYEHGFFILSFYTWNGTVINADYCTDYYQKAKKRKTGSTEMVLIEGANHTFSSILHFNQLLSNTSLWLLKHAPLEEQRPLRKSV
jgi:uncharacterized protein